MRHDQNMAFNTATKQLDAQLLAPEAQGHLEILQPHSINTIGGQNAGNSRLSAGSSFQSVMTSPDILPPTPLVDRSFASPILLTNQGELPSDMQQALSQTTGSSNQLWDASSVNQQRALDNSHTEIFMGASKHSPRRKQPTLSEQMAGLISGDNIMPGDSSSVVDPRFGIISSPDHIATMEVGSSLGAHRPPPDNWHASIQQRKSLHQQPNIRTHIQDHSGMRIATPPPQRFRDGLHSLGLLSDSFVVSDGGAYVNTDAEVKVRSGLSAIARQTPRPPPTQPPQAPTKRPEHVIDLKSRGKSWDNFKEIPWGKEQGIYKPEVAKGQVTPELEVHPPDQRHSLREQHISPQRTDMKPFEQRQSVAETRASPKRTEVKPPAKPTVKHALDNLMIYIDTVNRNLKDTTQAQPTETQPVKAQVKEVLVKGTGKTSSLQRTNTGLVQQSGKYKTNALKKTVKMPISLMKQTGKSQGGPSHRTGINQEVLIQQTGKSGGGLLHKPGTTKGNSLMKTGIRQGSLLQSGKSQGGPLQHRKPQGGALQPGKPQGGTLQPGKPQGGALQPGKPQGGALQPGKPQGGALQPGKPQGGALQSGKPQGGALQPGKPQGGALQPGKPQGGALQPSKPQGGALQPGKPQGGALQPSKPQGGALQPGKPQGGALQSGKPQGGALQSGKPQGGALQSGKPQRGVLGQAIKTQAGPLQTAGKIQTGLLNQAGKAHGGPMQEAGKRQSNSLQKNMNSQGGAPEQNVISQRKMIQQARNKPAALKQAATKLGGYVHKTGANEVNALQKTGGRGSSLNSVTKNDIALKHPGKEQRIPQRLISQTKQVPPVQSTASRKFQMPKGTLSQNNVKQSASTRIDAVGKSESNKLSGMAKTVNMNQPSNRMPTSVAGDNTKKSSSQNVINGKLATDAKKISAATSPVIKQPGSASQASDVKTADNKISAANVNKENNPGLRDAFNTAGSQKYEAMLSKPIYRLKSDQPTVEPIYGAVVGDANIQLESGTTPATQVVTMKSGDQFPSLSSSSSSKVDRSKLHGIPIHLGWQKPTLPLSSNKDAVNGEAVMTEPATRPKPPTEPYVATVTESPTRTTTTTPMTTTTTPEQTTTTEPTTTTTTTEPTTTTTTAAPTTTITTTEPATTTTAAPTTTITTTEPTTTITTTEPTTTTTTTEPTTTTTTTTEPTTTTTTTTEPTTTTTTTTEPTTTTTTEPTTTTTEPTTTTTSTEPTTTTTTTTEPTTTTTTTEPTTTTTTTEPTTTTTTEPTTTTTTTEPTTTTTEPTTTTTTEPTTTTTTTEPTTSTTTTTEQTTTTSTSTTTTPEPMTTTAAQINTAHEVPLPTTGAAEITTTIASADNWIGSFVTGKPVINQQLNHTTNLPSSSQSTTGRAHNQTPLNMLVTSLPESTAASEMVQTKQASTFGQTQASTSDSSIFQDAPSSPPTDLLPTTLQRSSTQMQYDVSPTQKEITQTDATSHSPISAIPTDSSTHTTGPLVASPMGGARIDTFQQGQPMQPLNKMDALMINPSQAPTAATQQKRREPLVPGYIAQSNAPLNQKPANQWPTKAPHVTPGAQGPTWTQGINQPLSTFPQSILIDTEPHNALLASSKPGYQPEVPIVSVKQKTFANKNKEAPLADVNTGLNTFAGEQQPLDGKFAHQTDVKMMKNVKSVMADYSIIKDAGPMGPLLPGSPAPPTEMRQMYKSTPTDVRLQTGSPQYAGITDIVYQATNTPVLTGVPSTGFTNAWTTVVTRPPPEVTVTTTVPTTTTTTEPTTTNVYTRLSVIVNQEKMKKEKAKELAELRRALQDLGIANASGLYQKLVKLSAAARKNILKRATLIKTQKKKRSKTNRRSG
ncbi:mucin-5AC-like [Pecten maximus]|uniref:mucin-5AC-like n=1 Tax=Pecten maximus TaxID=6579 RepID=UPI001458CA47|nr:mucin-5AC-like [Pecten maximus]